MWLLASGVSIAACDREPDRWSDFLLAPASRQQQAVAFPNSAGMVLERLLTLGSAHGPEESTFSFIGGAAFGEDGSVFVSDQHAARIVQFDDRGVRVRAFGRKGSGPGEFLSPTRMAVAGDAVFVLDEALGRISAFDTGGAYRRSIPVPAPGMISSLAVLADGKLAVTHATGAGAPLSWIDSTGRIHPASIGTFPGDRPFLPQTYHAGGGLCRGQESGLVYANPWVYELIGLDVTAGIRWSQRIASSIRVPVWATAADGPREVGRGLRQNAGSMGFVCSDSTVVLAYLLLGERRIFYDVLGPMGEPLAQFDFALTDSLDQPGFLADMWHDRLLTYRGRPFPHVSIFRIARRGR